MLWNRIRALRVLIPKNVSWKKLTATCAVAVLVGVSFCIGRVWALSENDNKRPQTAPIPKIPIQNVKLSNPANADPGRPVAYIYNTIPITRQDLGEYLIARFGSERINFLVNRKIAELACRTKKIVITDAEIEEQLVSDLRGMGIVKLSQFVNQVLKRYGKTLYEYKEDVIRPKLAMRKYCEDLVKVTKEDIQKAFEAKYGPMVQCRMIIFPKEQSDRDNQKIWAMVRKDENLFMKYAREQFVQPLAAKGGVVSPIHKHFGDKRVEKEAFSLQEGDVSSVIKMPDGTAVILKCDKRIDDSYKRHSITDEWTTLRQEVFERKLTEAIPKEFEKLKKQAAPNILLDEENKSFAAMEKRVDAALEQAALMRGKAMGAPPPPPKLQK